MSSSGRIINFSDGFESASAPTLIGTPASDITVTPSGNLSSTNAQSALVELQTQLDGVATSSDLANHLADATDAHAAGAITNTPEGNLSATTVQGAVNELQTDIDTRARSASPTITGTLDASAATTANIATSGTASTVNIGTGSGANTITIGGASSTVILAGTTVTENATNTNVADKLITINKGGAASSATGTGLEFEENGSVTGYIKTSGTRNSIDFKAPNTAGVISLTTGASTDTIGLLAAAQTFTNKIISGAANTLSNIAYSSLNLTGAILNADLAGSIAYSKLLLTGAIQNSDLAGAIAYAKLVLTGSIVNADISSSAAIAYSKLSLGTSIVNADINGSAAIARSKLAALTVSRAMVTDGSGVDSVSATTATELGYVNGVTSAIQTQLDAKVAKATLTAKGDIYVATGSGTVVRFPIGANGTILKANSAQTEGMEWSSTGAIALTVVSKVFADSPYTATSSDDVIQVSTVGGAVTINLPAVASNSGKQLVFKKTSGDTAVVTIDGNASETIDGALTQTMVSENECLSLFCDGAQWRIRSRSLSGVSTAYTPSLTNLGTGSTSSVAGNWFRNGREVVIYGTATKDGSSGTGSSNVTFSLPFTADTSAMPASTLTPIGYGNMSNGSALLFKLASSTTMVASLSNGTANLLGSDVPSGRVIYWSVRYIVSGWSV